MKYLVVLLSLLTACFATKGKTSDDPCAPGGASALGAEVVTRRLETPDGCGPTILAEYGTPNGNLGKKLYTIRSQEALGNKFSCGSNPLGNPGVDFSTDGVALSLWERRESESRRLLGIRDDGKTIRLLYELGHCSTGDPKQYTVDVDALILPVKDRRVDIYRCPVSLDTCAPK